MWRFDEPDFRTWVERRQGHEIDDLPATPRRRCLSCGTELDAVPYVKQATCGFCLAYEFGYADHENQLAEVMTGIGQIIAGDDREAFKQLYRRLLEDAHAALKVPIGGYDPY